MLSRNFVRQQVGLVRQRQQQLFFHKSAVTRFTIPFLSTLPQNPGGVKGSINDSLTAPHANKLYGGLHWDFEKVLAIGLIPLVGSALASSGSIGGVADTIFSGILLAHCYVGFQSCITDYIPKRVYGKNFNYAMYLLSLGSVISLFGIYHLEANENGLVGLVSKLWGPQETKEVEEKN